MSQELKTCPFCNGEAEMRVYDGEYFAQCIQCFCSTAADHQQDSDALTAWNRRPSPVPPIGVEMDNSPDGVKLEVFEIVCKERDRLQAENAELQKFKTSYMEWHDKTESLLQGFEAGELGRHRADVLRSRFHRLQAENAALQQRLNVADEQVDDLQKDKERLDSLEANYWDVRHHSSALGDTGDYTSCVEIVGHWMDKPHERVIGENYNENLRAAIDQAMKADAYPPARPEYPEIDTALGDEDWHMNPCMQGHRDVGACQGKAFCHACDETITAATTQEAFEQWNETHPATPK